ncbi:LURP-one-related family protein [Aerococcaceae bacterium DSM 111020]|nr:LURP-one-related family protein [Aerococcaceae bacterium DSM 111020]
MKFYMKQKLFSLRETFDIYDSNRKSIFKVQGKLLSLGKQLRVTDSETGEYLVDIHQKVVSLFPKMQVNYHGKHIATVESKISLFKPKYTIPEFGWVVRGDIFAHDYEILDKNGTLIATINKKFLSWSDTFEFDIREDDVPFVVIIGIILAIDMVMDSASD